VVFQSKINEKMECSKRMSKPGLNKGAFALFKSGHCNNFIE